MLTFALASLALPATAVAVQPNPAQRALERRLGPQAVVDIDASTGTPRVLARLDGTLTGTKTGAPEDIAMDYVRRNLDVLGLTTADLDTLEEPETSTAGGITQVRWRQAVDGIPAADAELRVNLTRDGRILNVLGSPVPDLDPDTTPSVTAGEAVRAVQASVGAYRSLPRDRGPSGPTRATSYVDGSDAELALFEGRLAWRVMLHASSREVYDAFVDAETGRVLRKHNMVKSAVDALVWERYPGAVSSRSVDIERFLDAGATTLSGPTVRAFSDVNDDDAAQPAEEVEKRGDGTFWFDFLATISAPLGCDIRHLCSWDPNIANSWADNRQQNAVQAFYFANRFYHDYLAQPPISFTEATADGVRGRPFIGNDRLILHTHDGANGPGGMPDSDHENNANMLTPPDGTSPVMQMYLWRQKQGQPFRPVNSGDDAAIVYHEYTHGLSNRIVTDALGFGALHTAQAGAMGEAWGDWYAQDFIVDQFPGLDTAAPGEIDMGEYVNREPRALRFQALDCPVGAPASACPASGTAGAGGYTYGDFGRVVGFPEVHSDGEIWAQTLWDLRTAVGSLEARRLITQGMRLSPPEPSFLDMRNAILQAAASSDQRTQIWQVFANRGMGFYAATTGSTDVTPIADTSMPPAAGGPRGRISGTVTDAASGAALNGVKATIGGLENGPDALADTTVNGAFAIENVPEHAYPSFLIKAPGYDQLITSVPVVGGKTTTLAARLRRNWAAASGGADASGDTSSSNLGCGPLAAIDQNPGIGWSTDGTQSRQLIVRMPNDQPVNITAFGIDPTATCGDDEESGTRRIRIETNTSTTNENTWVNALSAGDEFLPFRELDEHTMIERSALPAARNNVRRVRVTLVNNTTGGGPFIDLSEFAVYAGPAASVTMAVPPVETATPTATPTTSPVPTASAVPTVVPTPTPPPPAVEPPARPSLTLPKSAKRSGVRFKVVCRADCRVTARLVVAKSVARRLGLGRSRVAGTLTRSVKAGKTTTLRLKLKSKAARALRTKKVRSFRGTLRVGAAYAGASTVSRSRVITVKR